MRPSSVDLLIDVRELTPQFNSPSELIDLWETIQQAITGRVLSAGDERPVELGGRGMLKFTVLSTPNGPVTVQLSTRFAIHSILERPAIRQFCRRCASEGRSVHGPFSCKMCRQTDEHAGICDRHAIILEGGLRRGGRVVASCDEHSPKCHSCASNAEHWCLGPVCRGEEAWCPAHVRRHPKSADILYCAACYERVFPQCVTANCLEPGTNICEHVDQITGRGCGRLLCNRHVARWQVYGYERIGLARCYEHRRIRELADADVIWQVVAGTAFRHMQKGGQRYPLPTLGSIKNILLKGRKRFYDEHVACELYRALQTQIRGIPRMSAVQQKMFELLNRASDRWTSDVGRAQTRRDQGRSYLEKLKQELVKVGLPEIASAAEMTDFVPEYVKGPPTRSMLFVRLPSELKGRFIGKAGARIKDLAQRIGCEIGFEKGQ